MRGRRARLYDVDQRRVTAAWLRRAALTVVAAGLVVAAQVLATLGAATPRTRHVTPRMTVVAHPALPPYGGEPQLRQDSIASPAPWKAAVRFVRDYSAWNRGRLGAIPAQDATRRVIRLLEQAGRHSMGATTDVTGSVRVAPAGAHRYVVTSTIGNFLVGRRRQQWLVISLPGD
jgi:hypothetical protein